MKDGLRFGYQRIDLGHGQSAFVAEPEKAVLDLVHLHPGGDGRAYLEALRLDVDTLRLERLQALAAIAATRKLARAARVLGEIAGETPAYAAA